MPLWQWVAVGFALVLIIWRIVVALRRTAAGGRSEDWDERLIRNLRSRSSDPFKPQELDFFFSLASEPLCESFARMLQERGYSVDYKPGGELSVGGFSLHARKSMPVAVAPIQEAIAELRALAGANSASYDGWAAAGMLDSADGGRR